MKNRTIIGVICIALAVAIMFGISPFISILSSEKVDVIQLNKNIDEGTQITEADIVTVEIGKKGSPASVITNAEDVVGKFAATNLFKGTYLIPDMLTADATNTETVFKTLNGEYVAISISVPSFAAALSAKLENGDIVSVVVSDTDRTFIPRELTYVRVITTTTSEGVDRDNIDETAEGTDNLPATITLHVTPMQAKLLAEYELKADMHLALVSRGNTSAAKAMLSEQKSVLDEIIAEQMKAELEEAEPAAEPTEAAPTEAPTEAEAEDGDSNE